MPDLRDQILERQEFDLDPFRVPSAVRAFGKVLELPHHYMFDHARLSLHRDGVLMSSGCGEKTFLLPSRFIICIIHYYECRTTANFRCGAGPRVPERVDGIVLYASCRC